MRSMHGDSADSHLLIFSCLMCLVLSVCIPPCSEAVGAAIKALYRDKASGVYGMRA